MAKAKKSRKGVKRKATNHAARKRAKRVMDLLMGMTPAQRRNTLKLANNYQRMTAR